MALTAAKGKSGKGQAVNTAGYSNTAVTLEEIAQNRPCQRHGTSHYL